MSDPRASVTRAVLAPPRSEGAAPPAILVTAPEAVEEVRQIGKAHGRMRCVNLSLTSEAKDALYAAAESDGVTLGEALMDLIAQAEVAARRKRPDRAAGMRRGIRTVSAFVLLTPSEARDLVSKAEASGRSVSDYESQAVSGA